MIKNLLGISAGLAMGAAMFAAPASATLVLESDTNVDVGNRDTLIGACEFEGGGITVELACINEVLNLDPGFVESDAFKMEPLVVTEGPNQFDLFLAVDDTTTDDEDLGVEDNIWAVELAKLGGWFSIKTGNITCTDAANSLLQFGATCASEGDGGTFGQYFLVFENNIDTLFAVFDLLVLEGQGFTLPDQFAISHITIVPLPAAALLFGSALLGGGLMRRRKMIKKFGLPAA